MKAAHVTRFGTSGNIAFVVDAIKPQIPPKSSHVLIRVLTCAINSADSRLMNGSVSLVMKPKSFPYIPGMDVCGVIEEVGEKVTNSFKRGDRVVAVLQGFIEGGLAEYAMCDAKYVTLAPKNMSTIETAGLPIAGCTAMQAIKDAKIKKDDKVMVLGGSGGVGSFVVQLAKVHGASFVASTTTNKDFVMSLGADQVIDYRKEKWYEVFAKKDFDVIIDCVGCDESWQHCDEALKRGGKYVAVVDSPDTEIRRVWDILKFMGKVYGRQLNPFTTSYRMVSSWPQGKEIAELVALADAGKLRVALDPSTPFPFTFEGVDRAIAIQHSHRAKGKLVVRVNDE